MPSFINTNISSLNAQRNLNTSQSALATSLQRLSSGLRINSAKDDAAGMAISSRMTSQINGNNQAARNANDGISLAQTAEGDLAQIGTNLQRMRDLAVQSANATNSASDRAALQAEVASLAAEIDRVAQNSSFNGVKLLDGSFTAQNFQVGAGATANDSISISSIASARTNAIGSAGTTSTATVTGSATTTALAAGNLTLNGQQVGASTAGTGGGLTAASATQIAIAINAVSALSTVTATANATTVVGGAPASGAIAANAFSINGVSIGAVLAGGTAAGQGANVAAAINGQSTQTGVTASANATTGAVTLTAADGRD
ncbi:MAG: flagellin, partial [Gallionella sp.]|nr:flagellin [Gallionella sp.]